MSDMYVGEIRIFGGTFAPQGWAFCNGSTLNISEYETLYTLLGTTYGGDGVNTFNLPDLRSRLPVHQGTSSFGSYTLGHAAGTENVTLTTQQIPSHAHSIAANNSGASVGTAAGNVFGPTSVLHYGTPSGTGATGPIAVLAASTSQPHSNIMPYLGMNFIISLFGIYPSQN